MLERLHTIDWGKLTHAYGEASDVPELLEDLASADEAVREKALYELYGNIWHQGTVYEATSFAVPFLIELLEAETVAGKDEILLLLAHLIRGTSYHDVHQHLSFLNAETKEDFQKKIPQEREWVRKASEAVRVGEGVYRRFLVHPDSELRNAAMYLFGQWGPSPTLAAVLWKQFETETDVGMKMCCLLAFGALAGNDASLRNQLLKLFSETRELSLQPAAAMALAPYSSGNMPAEAVEKIVQAVRDPDLIGDMEETLWAKVDGAEEISRNYFFALTGEDALLAEKILTEVISTQKYPATLAPTELLLSTAFRTTIRRGTSFASLNEQQQRVLKVVAGADIWKDNVPLETATPVTTATMMQSCGLPASETELSSFIASQTVTEPFPSRAKNQGFWGLVKRVLGG